MKHGSSLPVPCVAMALAIGLVMVACERDRDVVTTPRTAGSAARNVSVVRGSKYRRADEDYMVAIGQEEPTFAGIFLDQDGSVTAYVADSTRLVPARATIQRHLAFDGLGLPAQYRNRPIKILAGHYSFQQLSDWRDLVTDSILGSDGVVLDDLDEAINRVTIGLPASSRAAVSVHLARLGVPLAAVHFREMSNLALTVGRSIHPRTLTA